MGTCNHICLVPLAFEHGEIQYGTDTVRLDGAPERHGSHAFTNESRGTAWYSVSAAFAYGAW